MAKNNQMKRTGILLMVFATFAFIGVLAAAEGDINKTLEFFRWSIGG